LADGSRKRDREALLAEAVERHADRGERGPAQILHLVEQEQDSGCVRPCGRADLPQQFREVLSQLAAVGHARNWIHIHLDPDPARAGRAEAADDPERPLDPCLGASPEAHRPEHPHRHARERQAEVRAWIDLSHVGRHPPRFARDHIELEEQDGLADSP
jgi:hypothetical protein